MLASKQTKKNNILTRIVIVIFAIVLFVLVLLYFFCLKPVVIHINEYVVANCEGYDGIGTCELSIDFDEIKEQYKDKLSYTKEYINENGAKNEIDPIMYRLKKYISISQDKNYDLHNGDCISYQITKEPVIDDMFKFKIEYSDGTYYVDGLMEPIEIDFFKLFNEPYLIFKGVNGETDAFLNVDFKGDDVIYDDGKLLIKTQANDEYGGKTMNVYLNGEEMYPLSYRINDYLFLKNGDVVTLEVWDEKILLEYGYAPKDNNIEFVVQNRPEVLKDLSTVTKEDVYNCIMDGIDKHNNKINLDHYEYDDIENSGVKKDYIDGISIGDIYMATPKNIDENLEPYFFAQYQYTTYWDYDFRYSTVLPGYDFIITETTRVGVAELTNVYYEDNILMPYQGVDSLTFNVYATRFKNRDYETSDLDKFNIENYINERIDKYNIEKLK